MPRQPQTPEEHAEIRRRIVEVARRVYDADGYSAVTMRNIARHAGYSPAGLYRYFSSHVELVRAIWQGAVDAMRDEAQSVSAAYKDPVERLAALLEAYARFASDEPTAFRSTFLQTQVPRPDAALFGREGALPDLDHREGTAYGLLRQAYVDASSAGRLADIDPDIATQTLWAAVHGVVALPFHFRRFPLAEQGERIDTAIRLMLRGLEAASC